MSKTNIEAENTKLKAIINQDYVAGRMMQLEAEIERMKEMASGCQYLECPDDCSHKEEVGCNEALTPTSDKED